MTKLPKNTTLKLKLLCNKLAAMNNSTGKSNLENILITTELGRNCKQLPGTISRAFIQLLKSTL